LYLKRTILVIADMFTWTDVGGVQEAAQGLDGLEVVIVEQQVDLLQSKIHSGVTYISHKLLHSLVQR
jgi:hypothetical protein